MPIRPFGFETDRMTVREEEAALLRDAATRIADGEALRAVVRDWHAAGVTTPAGNPWQGYVLRRSLVSDRIAGKRKAPDGQLVDAPFPAIIDPELYDRLKARLEANRPAPAESPEQLASRTYLLTGGLAVCGLCGKPLKARSAVKGKRSYTCVSAAPTFGCGKIRITAALLEDEVTVRVLYRHQNPAHHERMLRLIADVHTRAGDADLVLTQAKKRLEDLGVEYAKGRVSSVSLRSATATLKAEMTDARGMRRVATDLEGLDIGQLEDFAYWWESASIDQQRTLLKVLVKDVAVHPAPVKGSKVFAPERVKIRWN